jgi:hypothetical protein
MDVDLASDILLKLLEEEIFEIVVASQVGRENEKRAAADQQNHNQGDNKPTSDHSCSLDRPCPVGKLHRNLAHLILPNHLHEIY